jgi:hypothetical protein
MKLTERNLKATLIDLMKVNNHRISIEKKEGEIQIFLSEEIDQQRHMEFVPMEQREKPYNQTKK